MANTDPFTAAINEAGGPDVCFAPRRHPIVKGEHGVTHYGPWRIHYDPPPIPIRTMDWHFVHEDYDASYEGEEDGWVSNGLGGSCASFADALNECDALEDERTEQVQPC